MTAPETDIQIITDLGGPSKVAALLNLPKRGGQQRVQNWLHRGIPPAVKLARPDLFLRHLTGAQQAVTQEASHA